MVSKGVFGFMQQLNDVHDARACGCKVSPWLRPVPRIPIPAAGRPRYNQARSGGPCPRAIPCLPSSQFGRLRKLIFRTINPVLRCALWQKLLSALTAGADCQGRLVGSVDFLNRGKSKVNNWNGTSRFSQFDVSLVFPLSPFLLSINISLECFILFVL